MKIVRAISASCLLAISFLACDENPVSDDREVVWRVVTNPTVMSLTVATEKTVTGYGVNRYGEATFDRVDAQACDAKIAVRPDSTLLPFEPPTRVVARGVTLGTTCITFRVRGLVDTVAVTVR